MIDIFAVVNPEIFIADIEVVVIERKKGSRETFKTTLGVTKIPVLLINGNFPSKKYEQKIKTKIYSLTNYKENQYVVSATVKIFNAKFSSKIQYDFNFE